MQARPSSSSEDLGIGFDVRESVVLVLVLAFGFVFILLDVVTDYFDGASLSHMWVECVVLAFLCAAVVLLIHRWIQGRRELQQLSMELKRSREDLLTWKEGTRKLVQGLSEAIDAQLERWKLSVSEKEIALLLLKGLSLRQVAELRGTTEKTARAQSTSIYAKAGLAGRSELQAFFLEDLLVPRT